MDSIKLQVWEVEGLDCPDNIMIRVEHDVVNGSSIRASGKNLVEALQNLAEGIPKTTLADEFWRSPLVVGVQSRINKPEPEQLPITDYQEIGNICCNDDKPLVVVKIGNQYGWRIEKWNSSLHNADEYEIIPQYLYDALVRFESNND
jgi:hypothetical protein